MKKMQLINRISVLLLCIWFVEDVYTNRCVNSTFAGVEVESCYVYDGLSILQSIDTLADEINIKIKFTDFESDLYLVKSDRNILNENTTLWSISLDGDNHIQTSKSSLYETHPIIKDSQVYVDELNSAVLRIYRLNDVYIFEGQVQRYQLFYDDNNQGYFYRTVTPSKYEHYYYSQVDQKYLNLQLPEDELTIRLLIASDAIQIPSENEIKWIRYLLHHFTVADYIFSKFSSPSIKLAIAGLIFSKDGFEKNPESTEFSLSNVDRQYFTGNHFDVAYYLTNQSMPTIDNIEPSWSISAIKIARKIIFLNNLNSSNGLDINYLSIADDVTTVIQRKKLVAKFPFVLNVRESVQNHLHVENIWDYTPDVSSHNDSFPEYSSPEVSSSDFYLPTSGHALSDVPVAPAPYPVSGILRSVSRAPRRKPPNSSPTRPRGSIIDPSDFPPIDENSPLYYVQEFILAAFSIIGLIMVTVARFKKFFKKNFMENTE